VGKRVSHARTSAQGGSTTHTVQAGENLFRIALRYGFTAEYLAVVNGITDPATIRAGLAATVWPGRLEAFPGRPSWLLDAAHNPGGAAVLASALVGEPRPDVWLMTCLGDKDIAGVVERIAPLVGKVICTTLPMDRAISPEKLAAIVRPFNSEVHLAADPDEGMALAQRLAGPDGRILVAGSIYLLGHVRGKLTGETGP